MPKHYRQGQTKYIPRVRNCTMTHATTLLKSEILMGIAWNLSSKAGNRQPECAVLGQGDASERLYGHHGNRYSAKAAIPEQPLVPPRCHRAITLWNIIMILTPPTE